MLIQLFSPSLPAARPAVSLAAFLTAMTVFAPSPAFSQEHAGHAHHHIRAEQAVKLEVADDAAAQVMVLRVGPLTLPANTGHDAMLQAPDLLWEIPLDGWLVSYAPRLVDDQEQALPNNLLHHVAFWNTRRSDFLCPNKEEHIFGAGGEMNQWPALPGYGYEVKRGDRIRIATMFHNPSNTAHATVWLEIRIGYQHQAAGSGLAALHSVFPVWLDVQQCADSSFDLMPGPNVRSGEFDFKQAGALLGLGGHMHDYGRRLEVQSAAREQMIAQLNAQLDPAGHILSMPIVNFLAQGGFKIASGDRLRVTAVYENPTGRTLPDGAMGIAVGYFLPDDNQAMLAFRRPARRATGHDK
jgi:hypothetical protein